MAAREHLEWGRGKDAGELVEAACGAPFDATFYCDYLAKKFGELYQLYGARSRRHHMNPKP